MRFQILSIFLISFYATGQIQSETKFQDFDKNFEVFQSYKDELTKVTYEIGQFEFENCKRIALANPKYIYSCKNFEFPHGQFASVYFRVKIAEDVFYYFLDEYYDFETFEIQSKFEENQEILVFNNRYHFYVYDSSNQILSKRIIPGIGQFEREDAISGLLNAFSLTKDGNFLLGFAQGFGIFCYDISDPSQPKELKQFKFTSENDEEIFNFFQPIGNWKYLLISAQTDENFKSKHIENFYSQLKNLNQKLIEIN